MKKTIVHKINCTGRIFICIDENNDLIDDCENSFKPGKNYLEAKVDPENNNYTTKESDDLLLIDENNMPLYVCSEGFVLIEKQINKIALQKLWLN